MRTSARKTPVTADELPLVSARLSIQGKRTELVRGDLVVMAPAGGRHGQVAHKFGLFIGNHVTVHRHGQPAEVLRDTDILEGDPVLPDFAVRVGELFT